MVPSALRTMSVVTLLSAVSGTVALMNHHHGVGSSASSPAVAGLLDVPDGGRSEVFVSAALARNLRAAGPPDQAADQRQLRVEAEAQQAATIEGARQRAAAAAHEAAQARARAAERARVAADRRRAEIRLRASRTARRDPRALARIMVAERGWGAGQFGCLQSLWNRESGWDYQATNPSSGAYGIPQALPGRKMAAAGADWRTNPVTQMTWGLGYIVDRYGTPCGAWGHSESTGWY